jgi:hypothetical protein
MRQSLMADIRSRDTSRVLGVRVAVLTYRRPADLRELLPQLISQARSAAVAGVACDVLVVDNDPSSSACGYVHDAAASCTDVVVRYLNEPEPGISAARNRALEAAEDCDVLVFIDDDERPTPDWLALLLRAYQTYDCTAVVGPVVSTFEVEPHAWVQAGRFFDRRRLLTGTRVSVAATNNLLLDMREVRRLGLRFDPAYGISGGGDTLFTRQLHALGATLVWCDEAVVLDVVPAARATLGWVLRRALRAGTGESSTWLALADTPARRAATQWKLTLRGAARIAGGGVRLAFGAMTRSWAHQARGLRTVTRGAGLLAGAWGYQYREYQRTRRKP